MTQADTFPPGQRVGWIEFIKTILFGEKFDPLAYARGMSDEYGGFTYSRFGNIEVYQVADPELAHDILVERTAEFHKGIMKSVFEPFAGNGLLTSEGDFWKRQRKLAQPAFHYRRIESYAEAMIAHTQQMLARWQTGQTILIDREMMKLTLAIVAKTLFNADVSGDADRVGVLLNHILDAANERLNAPIRLPDWMPTPRRISQRRTIAELDAIINRVIAERRASGKDEGDLLSMLLLAQDEDGERMNDKQLRDEVMTLFLAGHETTANALTWAWYLLAQHPDVLAKMQAELDSVLGRRAPTLADLPHLPYNEMIVKETLRLFPPAPALSRSPYQDLQLGGHRVPKNALMQISIYAMQRSSRYFEQPDTFIPERFSAENEQRIPRYAYLPFGGGPRVCIGNQFALMEARLILALVGSRFELALVPGQQVVPQQMLTLRPRESFAMRVTARQPQPQPELA
jgi:cytochrome P450